MTARNALSGLLAALIALPMYYMFYSMSRYGFDTPGFITALVIGIVTFIVTLLIAYFVRRSHQKA